MEVKQELIGEIMLDARLITEDQLRQAVESQEGRSLGRTMVELGFVSEADIASTLAKRMHLSFVDISDYEVNPNAASLVSEDVALRYSVLPIDFDREQLVVAMSDPANVFAIDDLKIVTGYEVKPVVATETDLLAAIHKYCQVDQNVEQMVENAAEDLDVGVVEAVVEGRDSEEAPIVKLVNLVLTEAVRDRANDVHIEPQEKDLRIRYRVDGVLHEVMRSPKQIQNGVVSRIKILAGMDIAERRLPQDGRFGTHVDKKAVDFRVATLPTIHGEKIVLRILEKESILMGIDDLGLEELAFERFNKSLTKPYGAILVTGPTGSGKTTTLYAALNVVNDIEKNLITVEDPVEYRLAGVNQCQVNVKAGMTFAAALRSILRQDPDIVMIGEIRDDETALIAVESALTGHLVLSTLHTNDAPSSLTRLTEMGIEPFLSSSAIDCVVAQRLARLLCENCKKAYKPTDAELAAAGLKPQKGKTSELHKAVGCKTCGDTGYHGRLGLFEVMPITETIERLTVQKATTEEMRQAAIAEGMMTLREDGVRKVFMGLTSLEEIVRVTI